MDTLPGNLDVIKILSYGASGLSFLLMFLAYSIIRREQDRRTPRQKILNTVYVYMFFTLLNMIVVGVLGIPALRDNQLLSEQSDLLKLENYKVNSLYEIQKTTKELEQNADNLPADSIANKLKRNVQKLDTLSQALGEEDTEQKAEIERVKQNYEQKIKAVNANDNPQQIKTILKDVNEANEELDKAVRPDAKLTRQMKRELRKKLREKEKEDE